MLTLRLTYLHLFIGLEPHLCDVLPCSDTWQKKEVRLDKCGLWSHSEIHRWLTQTDSGKFGFFCASVFFSARFRAINSNGKKKVCVWINNHSHTLEVNITKMNAHVCIMCRMLWLGLRTDTFGSSRINNQVQMLDCGCIFPLFRSIN